MMTNVLLLFLLLLTLTIGNEKQFFKKYDAVAVKRFDDELRRLGIILPSVSKPDEPMSPVDPIVSSAAGDIEGHWKKSQFGRPIAAFEGIPYARPPVGPLRFKTAQPLTSRLTNFKAKKPGSKCTQINIFNKNRTVDVEGQEDCLFINIYVPENINRSKSLPVMFYLHGGSFVAREGDMCQSDYLLDHDIVLVTSNFRLGALGFLTTGDGVIPGNLALKDQVSALKWVHDNIAAFGGNPDLVTVFGHSSGAVCAEFLSISPLTKGLIHRTISISGSAFGPHVLAAAKETRTNGRKAARYLGCPAEPSQDLLACLLSKTAAEIIMMEKYFVPWRWEGGTIVPFKPVIEGNVPGAVLPYHPRKLLEDGVGSDVPLMTGITSNEGCFFALDFFTNDTLLQDLEEDFTLLSPHLYLEEMPPGKRNAFFDTIRRTYFSGKPFKTSQVLEASLMYMDIKFFWPLMQSLQYREIGFKSPAFLWYFDYQGSRSISQQMGFEGKYGVCHGDDTFYIFPRATHLKPTPADVLMSVILTELYTSFARDGVPSSKFLNFTWQPVTKSGIDIEYLHIKSPLAMKMEKDLLPERWNLMRILYEGYEARYLDG